MIQIANLKIDSNAPDYLPESLAREECVLPLDLDGDALRVALGRRDDYQEVIEKVEFVLGRRLVCFVADRERLERAIDEVYSYMATEVTNCPLDFHFECPKRWLELRPTDKSDVRFCESCSRAVHLCADENQAIDRSLAGHCVAIFRGGEDFVETIGILEFETPPVDQEHVPVFRAALRVSPNPQVAAAADEGVLTFLNTKVFDKGYLEFCDYFAGSESHSPKSRSEMSHRRAAIDRYLGLPILHGGLSHDGWQFNVFVDKASGVVIHFEVHREPS